MLLLQSNLWLFIIIIVEKQRPRRGEKLMPKTRLLHLYTRIIPQNQI